MEKTFLQISQISRISQRERKAGSVSLFEGMRLAKRKSWEKEKGISGSKSGGKE